MKKLSFVVLVALMACASMCQAQVSVKMALWPPEGWMAGGYGGYTFTFKNDASSAAKVTKWTAYWEVDGKPFGEQWGGELVLDLPAGKETTHGENAGLPVDVVNKTKPKVPVMAGSLTIMVEGKEMQLPFRIEVPAAELPEKVQTLKAKHLEVELMPSHLKAFKNQKLMLRWLDHIYESYMDLTGVNPDQGTILEIKESPKHPYWAYVDGAGPGLPVILNTTYVQGVLDGIDKGISPFGWIHEMGHHFDVLGKWYQWNGSAVEWQANWKISYAYDTMKDKSLKGSWGENKNAIYPGSGNQVLLPLHEWNDAYFLFFGDTYLADPTRKWDTLASDDIHSFCLRMARTYGWEPFRQWYRTYGRFEKLGLREPQTPEGKIQLMAAILSCQTGTDLVPVFQRWRMPVTREDIAAMNKKYPIKETVVLAGSTKDSGD